MVDVVQLVRASDCGSECRGFEPHPPPWIKYWKSIISGTFLFAKHSAFHELNISTTLILLDLLANCWIINKKQAAFHNVACFKNGLFKSSYVHTWYVRRLHIHRLISPNLVVTILCHITQFLLDTDKLVVLSHTVGTRE